MAKKLGIILLILIVLLLSVMAFFSFIYKGDRSAMADSAVTTRDNALVSRGEYLARAGDCVACHTAPDGQTFAGGLGIASPVGTIYSTNITPDKQSGIGEYTLRDFDNAVRFGVRKDGTSMYPAMPFPSFAVVTEQDVEALYAYFMQDVQPVSMDNKATDIPWPFSMRWPLAAWRMMFAPEVKPFALMPGEDPSIARGAYLVQGLGHCGSCHTPRSTRTLNEEAYTDEDNDVYLSGGHSPIDGWIPFNLRGDHLTGLGDMPEDELFEVLKTGRSARSAVFGGMADVVNHSLQFLNDDDLRAIARYLKTLPPVDANSRSFEYDPTIARELYRGETQVRGARIYIDNCAACHRTDGHGYDRVFPALAGNPVIHSENPASLINLVLKGHTLHGTQHAVSSFTMPGFAWRLSDEEIADLVSFIRTSWGNQAEPVEASSVRKFRDEMPSADRQAKQQQENKPR